VGKWVVYPKARTGQDGVNSQRMNTTYPWGKSKSRLAVFVVGFSNQQFNGEYRLYVNGKKKKESKVSANFIEITDIGVFNTRDEIKIGLEVSSKVGVWQVTTYLTDTYLDGKLPSSFSKETNLCMFADLIRSLVWDERRAEAEFFGKRIIERNPDCSDVWTFLGMSAFHENQYSKAISLLKRATEIDSTNPVAWNQLGIALINSGHLVESEDAFRKVLKIESSCSSEALVSTAVLTVILIVTNRVAAARELLKSDAKILLNEHPDISAELGKQWYDGVKAIVDKWDGIMSKSGLSQASILTCREVNSFANMITQVYSTSGDKELIQRATRLANIAESFFG
jgi:tetratricopeptide (TPR) repeat protein